MICANSAVKEFKLQHWRGLQPLFALKAAPVLEFGFC